MSPASYGKKCVHKMAWIVFSNEYCMSNCKTKTMLQSVAVLEIKHVISFDLTTVLYGIEKWFHCNIARFNRLYCYIHGKKHCSINYSIPLQSLCKSKEPTVPDSIQGPWAFRTGSTYQQHSQRRWQRKWLFLCNVEMIRASKERPERRERVKGREEEAKY